MDNCLMWSMLDDKKVYKKCPQVYELEAEVEQLRKALKEVGDYAYESHCDSTADQHACLYGVLNMTTKALEGKLNAK